MAGSHEKSVCLRMVVETAHADSSDLAEMNLNKGWNTLSVLLQTIANSLRFSPRYV